MTEQADLQQRLDTVEANVKELRTVIQALLHAQLRQAPDATHAPAPDAIGAWIAGELRDMAGDNAGDHDVSGYALPVPQHDSVFWCTSRFICITNVFPDCSAWC